MNILTAQEARTQLRLVTGKAEPMSKQNFNAKILPLMADVGDARKVGGVWIIDGDNFWMWRKYAKTRHNLIEVAGIWSPSRPWSLDDMESIVYDNEYEEYS